MSGKTKELLFLLIILAVAAFFRLWQLDLIPPGLFPDVAMNGNDALETLRNRDFKVFYPENNGREGLMMWLIALSFSVFGISIWSIKIVAAVFGILTVFGLYLLTKEILKNTTYQIQQNATYIALLSSFFLAISFWHVNFSRLGFRAILVPFVLVFGFYFLFRALYQKNLSYSIVAGIFFGLGFYTYISYRFIVLLLPLVLIPWLFIYLEEKQKRKFLFLVGCFLLVIFIVALPLGIYFVKNPQDFGGRASPVSVFVMQNPVKELGKSLILHLGMFNFYGDPNWRHNFATSPQIFWLTGILFLLGIFFSIKELIFSIKNKDFSLSVVHCLLLSWFFIFLLPGILTFEGIPHSLRTIGVIPPAFIFAGLGGWKVYQFLNRISKNKKMLIFAGFFLLFAVAASEYNKYFILWAKNDKLKESFTQAYADMGYFLNFLPPDFKKYVIVSEPGASLSGISIAAQTPMFIESTKFGEPRATYLKFEEIDQINAYEDKIVIIPLGDGRTLDELSKKFPWGEIVSLKYFKFYYLPD